MQAFFLDGSREVLLSVFQNQRERMHSMLQGKDEVVKVPPLSFSSGVQKFLILPGEEHEECLEIQSTKQAYN